MRASPHIACTTIAMITGFTPYSSDVATGSEPQRTYAHASDRTIAMAGTMKHTPPSTRPHAPARV